MALLLSSAFLLGLLGSLHCVGMCGPLVLAMPGGLERGARSWLGRGVYHLGRALTYGVLGLLLGTFGQGLRGAGWQQGLSILAGGVVLALAWPHRRATATAEPGTGLRILVRLRRAWAGLLNRPGWAARFALGALNGLLPCGLTYAALAAAALAGTPFTGFLFMVVFGLATTPALLAVAGVPALLRPAWRAPLARVAPAASLLLGSLFVLRGFGLGIPYLSPSPEALSRGACCAAAHPEETPP
jgi:sulfite exporter TauE/SafE